MSPRRASQPPPLPPLANARRPPPLPVGAKLPKQNRLRHPQPLPRPLPRSRPSVHVPSLALGTCGRTARCPLPLPAGAYNDIIHTFQHNYCVSCLPHPANDFFSFARSFTWSRASLRFGPGPGERPRKGFAAAHTIKAIVNNV